MSSTLSDARVEQVLTVFAQAQQERQAFELPADSDLATALRPLCQDSCRL